MDDRFVIRTDIARRFLHVRMTGLWDVAVVDRFLSALTDAFVTMIGAGAPYGELLTLIDMRDKDVMPRPALERLRSIVRDDSPSRRVALLAAGPLHGLQARRIATSTKYRVFADERAALDWLALPAAVRAA